MLLQVWEYLTLNNKPNLSTIQIFFRASSSERPFSTIAITIRFAIPRAACPTKQKFQKQRLECDAILCYFIYENYMVWEILGLFFPYEAHKTWFFVIFFPKILNYLFHNRDLEFMPSISTKLEVHYAPFSSLKQSAGFQS